ncbi:MAG: SpoIIE family protein phosphatase [Candidatus Eremiobacteraeota bacterium]|nr:SpoIIE family protein phosphatase [Candidatus Eremiobacteraeota bacterium]
MRPPYERDPPFVVVETPPEEFGQLLDALPQLVWRTDGRGRADYCNAEWTAYTGLPLARLYGWGWLDAVHPDDLERTRSSWRAAVRGETAGYEVEHRMRRSDGVYRWFLARGVASRDSTGWVTRWFGTSTDVDDRVRERERERAIAELSDALNVALGLRDTVDAMLRMLVPAYTDWCIVNLVDERRTLRCVGTAHCDAQANALAQLLVDRVVPLHEEGAGTEAAVRLRRPIVHPRVDDAILQAAVPDTEALEIFRRVGVGSAIVVPMSRGGSVRGTISILSPVPNRHSETDLLFFMEVGRRAASALAAAEAYERERRVAAHFQEAALEKTFPRVPGLRFAALYAAGASEAAIGGDWYDAIRLADGRIVLSVGDTVGSGIEAAVTMAALRQAVCSVAGISADPGLILDAADTVMRRSAQDRFATAWVGVLDPVTFTLEYAGAGHPAPLLRGSEEIIELASDGLPLGLRSRGEADLRTMRVPWGSALLLYTDGLTEARRDPLDGARRLRGAFARFDDPTRLKEAVAGRGATHDDIAMLVVHCDFPLTTLPQGSSAFGWVFRSDDVAGARNAHLDYVRALRSLEFEGDEVTLAELIWSELVGNVVRHAPGAVEVFLDPTCEDPVLHVVDRGSGFSHNRRLPLDTMSEGGRGLFIVSRVARDFSVSREPDGGSHSRVILPVRSRRPPHLKPGTATAGPLV